MTIRVFDGSLADAKALLLIEQATFDECPYTARQVQVMLSRGPQRAWLAVDEGEVAGFVIAFPASNRQGAWWEIDLLAVHPDYEGRGCGRSLIRAAAAGVGEGTCLAKAVVATGNRRSAGAFAGAGFQADPRACTMFIYRFEGDLPVARPVPGLTVRKAASASEAAAWLGAPPANKHGPILLAEQNGRPAGHAELIDVQTLLYRGTWIESLSAPSRVVREALVDYALHRAERLGLDEISALVPDQDRPVQHALLSAGFRSAGAYRWFSAALPLRD